LKASYSLNTDNQGFFPNTFKLSGNYEKAGPFYRWTTEMGDGKADSDVPIKKKTSAASEVLFYITYRLLPVKYWRR